MCAFILHSFWKVLFLVIIASPENAIISGPRSRQQTLMHTANIKSLVAREQKHSDYLDSTSKSFLWKFSGTWWQMSPVFYHQNSPASQNKLLRAVGVYLLMSFNNTVKYSKQSLFLRCVGDRDVEMCEMQLSLLSDVKRAWLSIPC